ncbi:MAG: hypothetical protein IJ514_08140 [Clostridia bacterium]|nr:hypothetical protein [Clostridia bacterium]
MKKKKLATLLACGAITLAVVGGFNLTGYRTNAYDLTLNLFDSRNMLFEEKAVLAESSVYSNEREGLRVSGKQGSYLEIDGMSGNFDMQFVPEGELKGVTFTFTDETTGNAFDFVVNYVDKNLSAYVACNGEQVGLYYANLFGLANVTAIYNDKGAYTTVANDYRETDVSFDPNTMSVAVEGVTVWSLKSNFSDGKSVGFAFDGFETYTTRMTFSNLKGQSSAMVYSVNGYEFTKEVLLPSVAPRIYANFTHEGVVGQPYTLPTPYAYDVADGQIPAEKVDATVLFGSEQVTVTDGAFTPQKAGEYTVMYSVENSVGALGKKSYTLMVNETFGGSFAFADALPEQEAGVHTLAYFPSVTYENAALLTVEKPVVSATVLKAGEQVFKQENASNGFSYAFSEQGEYEIVFAPVHNYFGEDTYRYHVNVNGSVGYVLDGAIQNCYSSGDTLQVPSLTFQTAEGALKAESKICFPDGGYYTANSVRLTQEGEYALIYTATGEQGVYEKTFTFSVKVALSSLFESTGKVSMKNGAYSWNENYSGLVVEMSAGATLTYKNVIDLSKYAFTPGAKNQPLFEVLVDPYTAYNADAVLFEFVLTDLYDPNNQVTIELTTSNERLDSAWGILRAGHSGYGTVGLEGDVDEKNNPTGHLWRNVSSGFMFNGSITASPNSSFKDQIIPASVYFDYEGRSVHANNHVGQENGGQRHLIADLDHESYFNVPWDGFTTGECTLELRVKQFANTKARLVFLGVDGNDFSNHDFKDEQAPVLTVDVGEGEIPFGVVGKKYPLFNGTAVDNVNGVVNVSTEVFYKYGDAQFHIDVKDGAFIPEEEGEYLVVYSAKDYTGNVGTFAFTVFVKEEDYYAVSPLTVTLEENYETQTAAGRLVRVAAIEALSGGAGRATYSVTVTDGNGETLDLEKGYFRPLEAGEYTVGYSMTDYLGERAEYTYEVNVTAHNGVIFETENLVLPKAVLTGVEYELPTVVARDYQTGSAVEKTATVSVFDEDGNAIELKNGKLVVSDWNTESVTVVYACEGRTETYSKTIPVCVSVDEYGRYQFASYFYGENVAVMQDEQDVLLTTDAQGARVEFLKEVVGSNFNLALTADDSRSGLQKFSVYLTNGKNEENYLKFTFIKNGDGALVSFNDGEATEIVGSFTGASNYNLMLRYKSYQKAFFDGRGAMISIAKTYANGEPFDGFALSTVKVSVTFDEFVGEAGIRFVSLNGQTFLKNGLDAIAPEVSYAQTVGGLYKLGETIEICDYYALDVLGNARCFVTVRLGNTYAKDTQGNTLNEYPYYEGLSVQLDAVGDYFIYLVSKDYLWLENKVEYGERSSVKLPTVSVNAEQAPTLSLQGSVPKSGKVGKKISLPTPKTDVEDAKLSVLVIDPHGTNWYVQADENGKYAYVPKMKGEHTVKYIVMDGTFNYLEIVKTVRVS